MTEIAFREAPFKTTGGTTARSLDDWFSDVVNVAEFANLHTGDGSFGVYAANGNDAPCFQRAFDLAFHNSGGTPGEEPTGVPFGWDERHLIKPVFIPSGYYRLTDPLVLTKVCGGHIYGAGQMSTQLHYEGATDTTGATPTTMLTMNGCSNLCIERMSIEMHGYHAGGDNSCAILIDWDADDTGNGCDGNHDNHFKELQVAGGVTRIIIGSDAASEGHNNMFIAVTANGVPDKDHVAYDVRGPNALNQQLIGGGGIDCEVWAQCPVGGGSLHHQGFATSNVLDYLMESGHIMHLSQGRSESQRLARLEAGTLIVHSTHTTYATTPCIEINGGKCVVEGCLLGNGESPGTEIIGTGGELLIAATFVQVNTTPLENYSGDILWDPENLEGL